MQNFYTILWMQSWKKCRVIRRRNNDTNYSDYSSKFFNRVKFSGFYFCEAGVGCFLRIHWIFMATILVGRMPFSMLLLPIVGDKSRTTRHYVYSLVPKWFCDQYQRALIPTTVYLHAWHFYLRHHIYLKLI